MIYGTLSPEYLGQWAFNRLEFRAVVGGVDGKSWSGSFYQCGRELAWPAYKDVLLDASSVVD